MRFLIADNDALDNRPDIRVGAVLALEGVDVQSNLVFGNRGGLPHLHTLASGHPAAQPHSRQQLFGAGTRLLFGDPRDSQRHHHVFESGKFPQQVMKLKHESDRPVPQPRQTLLASPLHGLAADHQLPTRR